MNRAIFFLMVMILVGCSKEPDTKGILYSGKVDLNSLLQQFTAKNDESGKDVILTKTGPHELTMNFNGKISRIDYEEDVIVIHSEADTTEWTARRVEGGFKLEDGTFLQSGDCQDWAMCLWDGQTKVPILKGGYSLKGSNVKITLWISESEKHVELLGLMANGLFNKSRNTKQSIETSLETLSSEVWAY